MERNDDPREPVNARLPWLRFDPGSFFMTPAAAAVLTEAEVLTALRRHLAGDWGDVDEHDRRENEFSLEKGFRLLSVYHTAAGTAFWVITEADRSHTTVLLPSDY